jgi:hypothetical protein
MDDEAPVARYDPAAGILRLRLTGGEEIVVGGLGPELPVWRAAGAEPPSGPLWLSAEQADVLGKMIDYILSKVKISAASQTVLAELGPQIAQLKDELRAASSADDEDYYDEESGP